MRVLIVGCGYVGAKVGEVVARQGHEVFGVRRSATANPELAALGIEPINVDIAAPNALDRAPGPFDWVVFCAAASGPTVEDYRRIYLDGALRLTQWLRSQPLAKLVYTSSTGVYGQSDGSEVDESSPAAPGTPTGEVLLEAEQIFLNAARHDSLPAVVLRVAGIYGPGRGFWLKQFLAGEARLEGVGRRILNMIHRDDVAGAVIAALQKGAPGEIYNAVDNEPVTQATVFEWLARTLGQPIPSAVSEDPPSGRRRGLTNKRVSNRKLREATGWTPLFPSFREGFLAELQRLGVLQT
ncbi:MAG: SDR family oxidoreductase [Verrucomicrobia bacterium]|jgi:nucleoside-diphosphate-sugar epimerase|nr:SDR family oxidoreductase [Verrucomicrobiota bacterium]